MRPLGWPAIAYPCGYRRIIGAFDQTADMVMYHYHPVIFQHNVLAEYAQGDAKHARRTGVAGRPGRFRKSPD
jgi:hypothetical protein